ncbi:hypothetical protein SAMN05660489_06386, partial [Pseudomonas sp. LAMO17WK12:I10]|uniref:hypothetical protein n=1 Tax=unclassified Pseudomonas TaxID=196821 RepID=UPI000BCF8230
LNVKFGKWGVDDLFYLDQQDNTAPQNNLQESTFLGGTGHGASPLLYLGGSNGTDGYGSVEIILEPDLPVITNSRLEEVVAAIDSHTGMIISG